ncbi:hypothetical protein BCR42DRAFT_391583 [Absidia repens]|uniref:Uncharacterized protein n=1 Tax=Absidia repens TaxID=90262 RepID=A0A1X2IKP6_9FUNG|nr:hypothetical protein BCR42DRAFT_391583 [Absidia repens]
MQWASAIGQHIRIVLLSYIVGKRTDNSIIMGRAYVVVRLGSTTVLAYIYMLDIFDLPRSHSNPYINSVNDIMIVLPLIDINKQQFYLLDGHTLKSPSTNNTLFPYLQYSTAHTKHINSFGKYLAMVGKVI